MGNIRCSVFHLPAIRTEPILCSYFCPGDVICCLSTRSQCGCWIYWIIRPWICRLLCSWCIFLCNSKCLDRSTVWNWSTHWRGSCSQCRYNSWFPNHQSAGDYLALVTLGFGEAIRLLLRNWDGLTNGPRGIRGIHRPSIFGFVASQPIHFYYIVLLFGVVTIWFVHRLKASPFGQRFIAIRDDENAAEAIGINPVKMKLYAFAIGAFFAGVMGIFFAGWQQFVSPESFSLLESIIILSMVILGGMGNIPGTIISAIFLVLLTRILERIF